MRGRQEDDFIDSSHAFQNSNLQRLLAYHRKGPTLSASLNPSDATRSALQHGRSRNLHDARIKLQFLSGAFRVIDLDEMRLNGPFVGTDI
jgi:hypothetical protein